MGIFILIILFIWGGYEALKHYSAEKYAKEKVHGEKIGFCGAFLLIFIMAMCFS